MSSADAHASRRAQRVSGFAIWIILSAAQSAHASLPDALNALRAHGCGGRPGAATPLHSVRKLDEAARRLGAGVALPDALSAVGYGAQSSAGLHVSTPGGDRATAELLEAHFCPQLTEPAARDIGVAHSGEETWIVIAAPLIVPQARDAPAISRRVLELVNAARGQPRRCGHEEFDATGALRISDALGEAALAHSADMAARRYFDHTAPDGSTPASRVTRTGYAWQLVGENLASGMPTPDEAVAGWLQSPAHCHNLMDPRFTDMGVGFIVDPKSPYIIYWTQVFGQARSPSVTR